MERPEVGKVGKAFKGSEGLLVWMVRVGKESDNEALLKYSGIDHPWSGKVLKAKVVSEGKGQDYRVKVDGDDYTTIVARKEWGGPDYSYEATLLNGPKDVRLYYDEGLSKEINPEAFLTEYLKQEGVIDK